MKGFAWSWISTLLAGLVFICRGPSPDAHIAAASRSSYLTKQHWGGIWVDVSIVLKQDSQTLHLHPPTLPAPHLQTQGRLEATHSSPVIKDQPRLEYSTLLSQEAVEGAMAKVHMCTTSQGKGMNFRGLAKKG